MTRGPAPTWVCIVAQLTSVVGDAFAQRCSRVYHNNSRRRFLISLVFVSSLQMLFCLAVIQLLWPEVTAAIYVDAKVATLVNVCGGNRDSSNGVGEVEASYERPPCYPQGPLTLLRIIADCPPMALIGSINICYYLAEASLYSQPLGLVLIVLASLTSSFMIPPARAALGMPDTSDVPTAVYAIGCLGSVFCLLEFNPKEPTGYGQHESPLTITAEITVVPETGGAEGVALLRRPSDVDVGVLPGERPHGAHVGAVGDREDGQGRQSSSFLHSFSLAGHLPLLCPFLALASTYCIWFITMDAFNGRCSVNAWGYNTVDQLLLPVYVLPMLMVIDVIPLCKSALNTEQDRRQSFTLALAQTINEMRADGWAGLAHMFVYRFFANTRAIVYSYLAVMYDLGEVYIKLTLIRVCLSAIGAALLVVVVPRFIRTTADERATAVLPRNVAAKVVGTALIALALVVLHNAPAA